MTGVPAAAASIDEVALASRRLDRIHLMFPGRFSGPAVDMINEHLTGLGWQSVRADPGHQVWRRPGGGSTTLVGLVLGLVPAVVTIASSAPPVPFGGRRGRSALRSLTAAVRRAGGYPVADPFIAGQVLRGQVAQQSLEDNRVRGEQIRRWLSHRVCPECQEWSIYSAQWCRFCEYEFTGADDHSRDQMARSTLGEMALLDAAAQHIRMGTAPALGGGRPGPRPPALGAPR
jgi:hypothetical protein